MENYLSKNDTYWRSKLSNFYESGENIIEKFYTYIIPTEFIEKVIKELDPNPIKKILKGTKNGNHFEERILNKRFINKYLVYDSAEDFIRRIPDLIFEIVPCHCTLIWDCAVISESEKVIDLMVEKGLIKRVSFRNTIMHYSPLIAYFVAQGLCFEKASLIVAIARANNIPARIKGDLKFYGKRKPLSKTCHFWAEIYNKRMEKWHRIETVRHPLSQKFLNLFRKNKGEIFTESPLLPSE